MLLLIHRNTIISLPGTGNIIFKTFLNKLVFTDRSCFRKDFRKKRRKKEKKKKISPFMCYLLLMIILWPGNDWLPLTNCKSGNNSSFFILKWKWLIILWRIMTREWLTATHRLQLQVWEQLIILHPQIKMINNLMSGKWLTVTHKLQVLRLNVSVHIPFLTVSGQNKTKLCCTCVL